MAAARVLACGDIWRLACGLWRLAFCIWHLAFGIWRLAFGIWHLAFGMWRLAFGIWRLACGLWLLAFGISHEVFVAKAVVFRMAPLKEKEARKEDDMFVAPTTIFCMSLGEQG